MQKVQGFGTCWHSCSDCCTNFLFLFLRRSIWRIYLSWNGRQLQLQTSTCAPCQALQLFLVMSWLSSASWKHFSITSDTSYGSHGVLFRVCGIVLNTMKNMWELREITFYCNTQFPGEDTCYTWAHRSSNRRRPRDEYRATIHTPVKL